MKTMWLPFAMLICAPAFSADATQILAMTNLDLPQKFLCQGEFSRKVDFSKVVYGNARYGYFRLDQRAGYGSTYRFVAPGYKDPIDLYLKAGSAYQQLQKARCKTPQVGALQPFSLTSTPSAQPVEFALTTYVRNRLLDESGEERDAAGVMESQPVIFIVNNYGEVVWGYIPQAQSRPIGGQVRLIGRKDRLDFYVSQDRAGYYASLDAAGNVLWSHWDQALPSGSRPSRFAAYTERGFWTLVYATKHVRTWQEFFSTISVDSLTMKGFNLHTGRLQESWNSFDHFFPSRIKPRQRFPEATDFECHSEGRGCLIVLPSLSRVVRVTPAWRLTTIWSNSEFQPREVSQIGRLIFVLASSSNEHRIYRLDGESRVLEFATKAHTQDIFSLSALNGMLYFVVALTDAARSFQSFTVHSLKIGDQPYNPRRQSHAELTITTTTRVDRERFNVVATDFLRSREDAAL